MMNAIEKLNEALSTMTTEQMGLEGDDLLNSLKAVKSVVKAIETLAKIGKATPTEPTEQPTDKAEPEFTEEIPAEAVENVEQEVEQEVEQKVDEYGLPQTDDQYRKASRKAMFAYENAAQERKDVYDELAKYTVKDRFIVLGDGREGWCEYNNGMLFVADKVRTHENGKTFKLMESDIRNSAKCREYTRNSILLANDGKMYLNGMPLKVAVVKWNHGGQYLAVFAERNVKDEKVNKAQILEYRDTELLKKLIFG